MNHKIHSVKSFEIVAPYTLKIVFEDLHCQVINFLPILKGEIYGPLKKVQLFEKATIDDEIKTIVWPNGADFDPALLYDWDEHAEELAQRANSWTTV
ncbi:MAG: DUF2442 domain-containing protein [Bacteroidota bacterium]